MRATASLDDDLLRRAQEYSGVAERTALLREALKAWIEREAPAGLPRWKPRCLIWNTCGGYGSRSMILADANIWIDFFRSRKPELPE